MKTRHKLAIGLAALCSAAAALWGGAAPVTAGDSPLPEPDVPHTLFLPLVLGGGQ